MQVDHGGLNILVAQQFLNRSDVGTGFEEMSRKAVAQRMRNRVLRQTDPINSLLEEIGEIVVTHMMPPRFTAARIDRQALRWENPLPSKLATLVGIFSLECMRQIHFAESAVQITLVQTPNAFNLFNEFLPSRCLRQPVPSGSF